MIELIKKIEFEFIRPHKFAALSKSYDLQAQYILSGLVSGIIVFFFTITTTNVQKVRFVKKMHLKI